MVDVGNNFRVLVTEFRYWWHLLDVGTQRWCLKIKYFGNENGQNRHQHLRIVANTAWLKIIKCLTLLRRFDLCDSSFDFCFLKCLTPGNLFSYGSKFSRISCSICFSTDIPFSTFNWLTSFDLFWPQCQWRKRSIKSLVGLILCNSYKTK